MFRWMLSLLRSCRIRRLPQETTSAAAPDLGSALGTPNEEGPYGPSYFEDPRDQIDLQEFLDAELSRTEENVDITEVRKHMTTSAERRHLTRDGLMTEKNRVMLQTCAGQLIDDAALVMGGRCEVCGGYTDRDGYFVCAVCSSGLCRLHAFAFDGFPLCPPHARMALQQRDTWTGEGRGGYRPC